MKRQTVCFTTGQKEGHARSAKAMARILHKRGIRGKAATAEQVHRSQVVVVPKLAVEKTYPAADGLLTDEPDQPLGIFTADCLPIFLEADGGRVVGVLHAGWRGVQSRILGVALRLLKKRWKISPRQVVVTLGPAIGPCCFQVRWDVARYFPGTRRRSNDRWTVDLPQEVRRQAKNAGVPARAIHMSGRCTHHGRGYYSYRRDKTENRQVSVIVAKEQS